MVRRSDADFRDEIDSHIQLEADQLVAEGVEPEQALARARRRFGNVTSSQERYYESSRAMWLENLLRDARLSLREMRRSPVSTLVIVVSLALGIGASTSIFSLAHQAFVRQLPVPEPERIAQLRWEGHFVGGGVGFGSLLTHPFFRDLRAEQDVFVDLFARAQTEALLLTDDESELVRAELVSGSYFPTLGLRPAVGRLFDESDDRNVGAHPQLVLSHDYWRRRFGADPDVVGSRLRVNDEPMTVVGVAPPGFCGTDWGSASDVFVPLAMMPQVMPWPAPDNRRERSLHVFARLPKGLDAARAQVQLQPWFDSYMRADIAREGWPSVTERQMERYLASTLEVRPGSRGQGSLENAMRRPILILSVAAGLCLLLACLNVANLSLARTLAAQRATAMRTALGASRARVVSRQLVESATLALAGLALGALLAPLLRAAVLSYLLPPGSVGLGGAQTIELPVFGFAVLVAVFTTVVSGAAPAWHAAAVRPVTALKASVGSVASGLRSRRGLVVSQFALALVLLIGAGLFARTLSTLRAEGPGFTTANLLMFRVTPARAGFDSQASKAVLRRLRAEIESLPDVEVAGLARWEPLRAFGWNNPLTLQSSTRYVTEDSVSMNAVSPGFFQALGASFVQGRDFDARDARDEPGWELRSAIVNEEFVSRYLPAGDALATRVGIGNTREVETEIRIVGVVRSFHTRGLREQEPLIYFPLWERSAEEATVLVRARTTSARAGHAIQDAVRRVDPRLAPLSMRTMDDQLDRLLAVERVVAVAAVAFAVVATLLAMVGLFGLLSFSATLRRKEIGIRIALGAAERSAAGLIVKEALVLAAAGACVALPVSVLLGRLVESSLYGVAATDVPTLAFATLLLIVVCLLASAGPARRAASVSPVDVLRDE